MGKGMHGQWVMTLEVENSHQNKVCQQNNHVRKNFGIQSNNLIVLWQAKKIEFATTNLEGRSVRHC